MKNIKEIQENNLQKNFLKDSHCFVNLKWTGTGKKLERIEI